nr:hypothetical protein [Tanacetum cinerariifolium]
METSNNPYAFPTLHQDQPSFNQNYMQQPMPNLKDITDPTTAMNMALALMAKAFKLNYSTPTNNNQRISSNPRNRQIAQSRNLNGYNDVQNVRNQVIQHAVQNPRIQNVVQGNTNQNPNGNGNLVAARAEGNATGHNGNQIRCYNCRGVGHFARNSTVIPKRRDDAYLQTQLLIAQKEKAGIQLQAEEFDLMAAAAYLDEIEEVNKNCILMANLQQASTLGHFARNSTVIPKRRDDAYLQTQLLIAQKEEAGIQLQAEEFDLMAAAAYLDEIEEVNENCILMANLQQASTLVEKHPKNVEETRVLYDSLYNNLAIEVEKVNTVNRKLRETNAELITELERFKNQEKCFEISQEKYDKLERCYQKSVYQEQCLFKKINALHLSSGKQIMTLNEEILDLNKQLSMEKSPVSSLFEEKKKLKSDFKIREDELLDKQIQLEKRIKELDNILVKTGQSIQTIHMLSPKTESFYHTKQKMALETHNWSSSAHQELHKIVKDEIFPIINQVDATVQNFEIQFLKEAVKFVGDFKSLAKKANESLVQQKALKLEIKRLLRAVVSQDIMFVVQNKSVVDTSYLKTELKRTKNRFENCIIKKKNEYAKLWNDWYKKCEECKYDKISYDKAYNDMQQKIERLQAQLGDLKGKSKDTSGVSDTLSPLSQKLKNENVELEFHVLNYAKENAHLKTTYKNLFDSISLTRTQTKTIIVSLQKKLQDTIYENTKLRAQLFDKVSDQKDITRGKSANTKFAKKSILGKPPKVGEIHALSKPVTSNSNPTPQESKVVKTDKVISPGIFRINPFKPSREESMCLKMLKQALGQRVDNTKTRRPQPRSNTKNDRVPSASKSSRSKNKEVENVYSKVVCAMCKQCLISVNHDVCLLNYVNDMNSRGKNQKANVSIKEKQKKQKQTVMKPKKVRSIERLATPKPSKPRSFLRWSPTGRMFDLKGKIIASSESESQSNCSKGDNACTSNPMEPTIKRFPNSTFSLAAIATACFTQNYSIIHRRFYKTPYELINSRKPDISFLHVFGVLCYPKNDHEDIGKLGAKGDIGFFIAYSVDSCAYRVSKPGLQSMTSGQISSGLDFTYDPSTITTQQPTEGELDLLFEAMYDDYIGGQPSAAPRIVPAAQAPQVRQMSMTSTSIADTAPSPKNSSSQATNFPNTSHDIDELNSQQQHVQQQENHDPIQPETVADNVPYTMFDANTFVNPLLLHPQDYPLEQVIGEPSRLILTRNQLRSDGEMCMYALTVSTMEPKNVKEAMTDPAWIESMQEKLLQFKRLDVWVLVPAPNNISPLTLKWLFKNKHGEEQTVIRNKSRLDDILAYAAHRSFTVFQMDVKTAFLHGTLKKDVYVCQPEGFINADHPSHVFKLKNALYGFKQAPRVWYDELSTFLLQNHFFKGTTDPTLFIRRFVDDILVVQVYVDDIIFGSTHPRYTQLFSDLIKSRFEMSMMREMTFFLGLQVNQSPCGIFINQSNYVLEILKKYGMESCDPVGTPMEIKYKLDLDQNGTPFDATKYRSIIGALMYLTSSRPDIDFSFELTGFSDADYAGCKETFKSTFGGAQFLGKKLLTDYGIHFNKIPIYCDSKSAIAISCNPVQHSRTKHIAVRYHFIKEHVEKGTIELYFDKTDYQLADLFTKALPVDRFNYLVRRLGSDDGVTTSFQQSQDS